MMTDKRATPIRFDTELMDRIRRVARHREIRTDKRVSIQSVLEEIVAKGLVPAEKAEGIKVNA